MVTGPMPAFGHDLARGAGRLRQFLVMEASPGPVNWHDRNPLKRPGRVRLEGLQAVARGSRGMLYFQVRQARAGAELNHAALIPRHGRLDTRTGGELMRLSADLRAIGLVAENHGLDARVALVFDWPSWWGHHNTPGLDQRSRYFDTVPRHPSCPRRTWMRGRRHWRRWAIRRATRQWSSRCSTSPGEGPINALAEFVRGGGLLVTTCGSAVVGDDCQVHPEGVDPAWREVVGLWVEETDVQPAATVNRVVFLEDEAAFEARELFDIVRLESAVVLAEFRDDFYAGSPAVTINRVGEGTAVYVASPTADLVAAAVERALQRNGPGSAGVERLVWRSPGDEVAFILNHGEHDTVVELAEGTWTDLLTGRTHSGAVTIAATDAVVVRRAS